MGVPHLYLQKAPHEVLLWKIKVHGVKWKLVLQIDLLVEMKLIKHNWIFFWLSRYTQLCGLEFSAVISVKGSKVWLLDLLMIEI